MRILQVEKYYWPQGGASQYALTLSQALRDRGHTVIPFAVLDKRNLPSKYSQYFVDALDFSTLGNVSWWRKVRAVGQIFYSYEAKRKLESLQPNVRDACIPQPHPLLFFLKLKPETSK
jgi:hypothetical protein